MGPWALGPGESAHCCPFVLGRPCPPVSLNCFSVPSWALQSREDLASSLRSSVVGKFSWGVTSNLTEISEGQGGALRADQIPFSVSGLTPQNWTLGSLLRFLFHKHQPQRNRTS